MPDEVVTGGTHPLHPLSQIPIDEASVQDGQKARPEVDTHEIPTNYKVQRPPDKSHAGCKSLGSSLWRDVPGLLAQAQPDPKKAPPPDKPKTPRDLEIDKIKALAQKGKEGVAPLRQYLLDRSLEESLRIAAALALGEIGPEAKEVLPDLKTFFSNDRAYGSLECATAIAFARIAPDSAEIPFDCLENVVRYRGLFASLHHEALETLKALSGHHQKALDILFEVLASGSDRYETGIDEEIKQAIFELGPRMAPVLVEKIREGGDFLRIFVDDFVRTARAASEILGRFGREALPLVVASLDEVPCAVRRYLRQAILQNGNAGVPFLLKAFREESPLVQIEIKQLLVEMGPGIVPELVDGLAGSELDEETFRAISYVLDRIGWTAIPELIQAGNDERIHRKALTRVSQVVARIAEVHEKEIGDFEKSLFDLDGREVGLHPVLQVIEAKQKTVIAEEDDPEATRLRDLLAAWFGSNQEATKRAIYPELEDYAGKEPYRFIEGFNAYYETREFGMAIDRKEDAVFDLFRKTVDSAEGLDNYVANLCWLHRQGPPGKFELQTYDLMNRAGSFLLPYLLRGLDPQTSRFNPEAIADLMGMMKDQEILSSQEVAILEPYALSDPKAVGEKMSQMVLLLGYVGGFPEDCHEDPGAAEKLQNSINELAEELRVDSDRESRLVVLKRHIAALEAPLLRELVRSGYQARGIDWSGFDLGERDVEEAVGKAIVAQLGPEDKTLLHFMLADNRVPLNWNGHRDEGAVRRKWVVVEELISRGEKRFIGTIVRHVASAYDDQVPHMRLEALLRENRLDGIDVALPLMRILEEADFVAEIIVEGVDTRDPHNVQRDIVSESLHSVGRMSDEELLVFMGALRCRQPRDRFSAILVASDYISRLKEMASGSEWVVEDLIMALGDTYDNVAINAVGIVGELGAVARGSAPTLGALVRDRYSEPSMRSRAAMALERVGAGD